MPRYSSHASTSTDASSDTDPALASLSDILEVDPTASGFTCVGYAPTQGRRCRNPINQKNKRAASSLLAKGDDELNEGGDLRELFKELAPRVLCKHNHQGQAEDKVGDWMAKVGAFKRRQARNMAREPSRHVSSRSADQHGTSGNPQNESTEPARTQRRICSNNNTSAQARR